jgi:DNA invertase Pin-like site-specific DNA recombinase
MTKFKKTFIYFSVYKKSKPQAQKKKKMIRMYLQGDKMSKIMRELHTSLVTIRKYLKEENIPYKYKQILVPKDVDEVLRLIKEGYSLTAITVITNQTLYLVTKILKDNGVKAMSRHQKNVEVIAEGRKYLPELEGKTLRDQILFLLEKGYIKGQIASILSKSREGINYALNKSKTR